VEVYVLFWECMVVVVGDEKFGNLILFIIDCGKKEKDQLKEKLFFFFKI